MLTEVHDDKVKQKSCLFPVWTGGTQFQNKITAVVKFLWKLITRFGVNWHEKKPKTFAPYALLSAQILRHLSSLTRPKCTSGMPFRLWTTDGLHWAPFDKLPWYSFGLFFYLDNIWSSAILDLWATKMPWNTHMSATQECCILSPCEVKKKQGVPFRIEPEFTTNNNIKCA